MTDKAWRLLAEFAPEGEVDIDQQVTPRLNAAVQDLNLPPALVDQLRTILAAAVRRVYQRHVPAPPGLRVLVRVQASGADQTRSGWGFFLVEKRSQGATEYAIDLCLYQDGE